MKHNMSRQKKLKVGSNQLKARYLTKEKMEAMLSSPVISKKREIAQDLFKSPQFKAHIRERNSKLKRTKK